MNKKIWRFKAFFKDEKSIHLNTVGDCKTKAMTKHDFQKELDNFVKKYKPDMIEVLTNGYYEENK